MASVAQHGDAPADAEHLVEPVGDVDDRHAARREPLDQGEQLRDLAAGQRRGRLVHHETFMPARRSLGEAGPAGALAKAASAFAISTI